MGARRRRRQKNLRAWYVCKRTITWNGYSCIDKEEKERKARQRTNRAANKFGLSSSSSPRVQCFIIWQNRCFVVDCRRCCRPFHPISSPKTLRSVEQMTKKNIIIRVDGFPPPPPPTPPPTLPAWARYTFISPVCWILMKGCSLKKSRYIITLGTSSSYRRFLYLVAEK